MAFLAPLLKQHFEDANGIPLAGGKVFTYVANTTTPAATYIDPAGATPNENPIILDARGECDIYLLQGPAYKFVIEDADGVTIDTIDNVSLTSFTDSPIPSGGQAGWVLIKNSGADYDYTFAPPEDFQGIQGEQGDQGEQGIQGDAGTIAVGTVTGLSAGATPTIVNVGTGSAAILNFGIPAGATGATGSTGGTGPTGPTGPQGYSFRTGEGPPDDADGINGDSYLDLSSGDTYTKVSGSWDLGTTIAFGGGSGSPFIKWLSPTSDGAVIEEEFGAEISLFTKDLTQRIRGRLFVPSSYVSGTPIILSMYFYSPTSSGKTYGFQSTTTRINAPFNGLINSTTNQYTFQVDASSTANYGMRRLDFELTNSSGLINSGQVLPKDVLIIDLIRVTPLSGTEDTSEVRACHDQYTVELT